MQYVESDLISRLLNTIGSLSNHDDGNNNVINLHIWRWKTIVLRALHVHFLFFHISHTFSFFPQLEMTCFAVVWTTWTWWQVFSFVHLSLKRWFQFDSRIVGTHCTSVMTLNNLYCRNVKLHFQMTFSLSATSCFCQHWTLLVELIDWLHFDYSFRWRKDTFRCLLSRLICLKLTWINSVVDIFKILSTII